MRDIFTHKLTSKEHWDDLLKKPFYSRADLDYNNYVSSGTVVPPSYDPHCANGEISDGCEPVAIISADKLRDYADGPAETTKIANALMMNTKTGQFLIAQEAWDCIWKELIEHKKGPRIMADRPGYAELYYTYNFSAEMLLGMIDELNRLITKYGSAAWNTKPTANRLVEILVEHLALIEAELEEVNTGARRLTKKDFLGPSERTKRRDLRSQEETDGESERKDHSEYFIGLEQKRFDNKRREMKQVASMREKEGTMSDADFTKTLSNALSQIRTLEAAGGLDRETASDLAKRVRMVAMDANVVLAKGSEEK